MGVRAAGIGFFLLTLNIAANAPADRFEWQAPQADHVDLDFDGKPVLRYEMPTLDESSEQTRNDTFKPYHQVFSPDGQTLLTKGTGGLFPHHRGLFYGFNKISYGDGKQCDMWHCTGKTFQSHEEVIEQTADDDSASQVVAIDWHGQEGELFAHETREIEVRRTKHDSVDGWQIDFASHLETADGKPIHLDGDPQHAGFQFRATQKVPDETAAETYYLRTDGRGQPGDYRNWDHENPAAKENAENENRPWNAMSFVVDGQRFTVLYLDHPSNPKPARYSERDYGRFGSYFVADVTKDEPLDVKYRLWVQPGEMTVEECATLSQQFISE
ncbi:DUF6807 family protein [Lacipirellula limnantheis]|uniref:Methane oxygenase PmoA n=1 Tax=Lacipirellula limnantheis TaxID=2528024 RepID=A0A517TV40_9BACT|nr:DUF6807 family protein [Lacipirellula limnantheis]QDT72242.1 hypothetical protein I41_14130 [Lacipirellula limnantheis]